MSAGTTIVDVAEQPRDASGIDRAAAILVFLGPAYDGVPSEQLAPLFQRLADAFSKTGLPFSVAVPSGETGATSLEGGLSLIGYRPLENSQTVVVQTAGCYLSAFELMRSQGAVCAILLGGDADSLDSEAVSLMADAVVNGSADLAIPRYAVRPDQGLLNSAVLSPLSRALYGLKVRYPLPLDAALSFRMAERMATAAQRMTASGQNDGVLWPVAEAATSGFTVAEIACGERNLPATNLDLGGILNSVAGSLFSDIEAKASFWQRTRPAQTLLTAQTLHGNAVAAGLHEPADETELHQMMQTFRLGYSNLHEIWSLVLPPNTLLGLKRLSLAGTEQFVFADALWTRVVYDFTLAHRLRTLNRGHLLGAFAPLYLGWVASHLQLLQQGAEAETHLEQVAKSFEADKPYLVSRWRWPDRFNP